MTCQEPVDDESGDTTPPDETSKTHDSLPDDALTGDKTVGQSLNRRSADKRIPTEQLLIDLQTVAAELGRAPKIVEYESHGQHSYNTIRQRFDNWEAALEEAGLDPDSYISTRIPDEELVSDFANVVDRLGRSPSTTEYSVYGEYSPTTLINRFGSWQDVTELVEDGEE